MFFSLLFCFLYISPKSNLPMVTVLVGNKDRILLGMNSPFLKSDFAFGGKSYLNWLHSFYSSTPGMSRFIFFLHGSEKY